MLANGDSQHSLAGGGAAVADQPSNEPQNSVLNNGTAAGDVTDDSHISSTDNEDAADHIAPATGDSQTSGGASSPAQINGGISGQDNSPTNGPIQEGSDQSATDGASDQQDAIVIESFEHYEGE